MELQYDETDPRYPLLVCIVHACAVAQDQAVEDVEQARDVMLGFLYHTL